LGLLALVATSAPATTFTLDFGGLQDGEEVLSYYDAGFGSLGSGPGPDFGITFTPSFLAVMAVPPYGPDRVGELNGSSAIMDVESGFTTVFSFYYEASDNSGLVTIWSGLDGTGSMLASIPLTAAADWTPDGAGFGGTAMSVVFSGTPRMQFDQINDVGFVVPEPSSLVLFGTGFAGVAAGLRRLHPLGAR
jgi:hypothetical protein